MVMDENGASQEELRKRKKKRGETARSVEATLIRV
jgi:hypothetical protein